jgi:hypothetical protein
LRLGQCGTDRDVTCVITDGSCAPLIHSQAAFCCCAKPELPVFQVSPPTSVIVTGPWPVTIGAASFDGRDRMAARRPRIRGALDYAAGHHEW